MMAEFLGQGKKTSQWEWLEEAGEALNKKTVKNKESGSVMDATDPGSCFSDKRQMSHSIAFLQGALNHFAHFTIKGLLWYGSIYDPWC